MNPNEKTLKEYLKLRYRIIIDPIIEDDGKIYWETYIPTLGGNTCIAIGKTPKDALDNLDSIRENILEDWYKEGLPIPLPKDENRYEEDSEKPIDAKFDIFTDRVDITFDKISHLLELESTLTGYDICRIFSIAKIDSKAANSFFSKEFEEQRSSYLSGKIYESDKGYKVFELKIRSQCNIIIEDRDWEHKNSYRIIIRLLDIPKCIVNVFEETVRASFFEKITRMK